MTTTSSVAPASWNLVLGGFDSEAAKVGATRGSKAFGRDAENTLELIGIPEAGIEAGEHWATADVRDTFKVDANAPGHVLGVGSGHGARQS